MTANLFLWRKGEGQWRITWGSVLAAIIVIFTGGHAPAGRYSARHGKHELFYTGRIWTRKVETKSKNSKFQYIKKKKILIVLSKKKLIK